MNPMQDPEVAKKQGLSHRGTPHLSTAGDLNPAKRPEVREKIRQSKLGDRNPGRRPEEREKNRLRGKKNWQNPEYVTKQIQARNVKQNKAERKLQDLLNQNFPGLWKFVGDGQLIIAGKCPDFVDEDRKLIIELFGDYWHKPEEISGRIHTFAVHGYKTLIVWEHELDDSGIVDQIRHLYTPCIYYSHPIRGICAEENNYAYEQRNCCTAVQNILWLRENFPMVRWYCPGEVEPPIMAARLLGYLKATEVLEIDFYIIKTECNGGLVHRWEGSFGTVQEEKLIKELDYPSLLVTESRHIWECDIAAIGDLVDRVVEKIKE